MKRKASLASLSSCSTSSDRSDNKGENSTPRVQLEALAQAAMMDGLSKAQVVYEQWVDTQPIEEVASWEEMSEDEKREWCVEHGVVVEEEVVGGFRDEGEKIEVDEGIEGVEGLGGKEEEMVVQSPEEEISEEAAVGDLGEDSKWIAVQAMCNESEETLVVDEQEASLVTSAADPSSSIADTSPSAESILPADRKLSTPESHGPFRADNRVWTATTLEDSEVKNKPQCPPCARLKRTWTRCRGGPPCVECQHRGLSASQCQSYELLNRSRKNRQQKKQKMEDVCKMMQLKDQGPQERIRGDVMEGGEGTGGLDSLEVEGLGDEE